MLLSTLMPELSVDCVGALDITINNALLASTKEFYRRSQAWRVSNAPVGLPTINADGSTDYTVTLPVNTVYKKVIGVRQGNFAVEPISEFRRQQGYTRQTRLVRINFDSLNNGVTLSEVVFESDETVAGQPLTVSYSLEPTAITTNIDDATMVRWGEIIQYGALFRLFKMPSKAWTSPNDAQLNFRLYEVGIAKAGSVASRGNSGAPIRSRSYS